MSKGPIFIVASSAIILVSFGALCYLMTIVNPKPLKSNPEDARRYSSVDTLYVNDVFLPSDHLDYGLEKVSERYAEIINNITEYPLTRIMSYVHGPSGDITKRVVPPVWPRINYTKIITNCTSRGNETSAYFPIKGHRRSIRDEIDPRNQLKKSPSSFIVKIVDGDGIQKIEIKMGAKPVNNKNARNYRSSNSTLKNKFSNRNKTYLDDHNNTEDTVVILEVNDTIVLNIIGDSVVLSGGNKIETEFQIDKATLKYTNEYSNINSMSSDGTKSMDRKEIDTRMFDLLKIKMNNLINKTDLNNGKNNDEPVKSKNLTQSMINHEAESNKTKSVRLGIKDVKNNHSVVDLLILEDSLRGTLIDENSPFILNENTFNNTE